MSSDLSSLNNLSEYLNTKKFEISETYSIGLVCIFLRVTSEDTGDDFLLSVGKEHNIKNPDGVELVPFTDTERVVVKMDSKNSYGEINSEGIEEDLYLDPTEVDRMMDQYQAIDLDSEKADVLRENISMYKSQLERLKFCTNNIKYKLSVVSKSSVCYINRANTVECFAIRRSNPKIEEDKNLCIVIDLETFIDSPDYITSDIKRVTKNLHNILGTAHGKQSSTISLRLKQIQTATIPLLEKYNKKEKYLKSIEKLTVVVVKIRKQERELLRMKKLKSQNTSTSITDTENKAFSLKKLDEEYTKLMKFKKESVDLLSEIKLEYNNFILNFDFALFDTLRLLNDINRNLSRIGVMKCKKGE